jgi:hypothetical protein
MLRLFGVACVLVGLWASAQPGKDNVALQRARANIEALSYAEALRALEDAWQTPGNDRETVLEILRLQGLVATTLQQPGRAQAWFGMLLYLDPGATLPVDEWGPKPLRLLEELRAATDPQDVLRFQVLPPEGERPRVRVAQDRLKWGESVRFHFRAPQGAWSTQVVPLAEGEAELDGAPPGLAWWAELLGERVRALAQVGSAQAPLTTRGAGVAAAALAWPRPDFSRRQWTGVGLAATGVVALGGGAVLGLRAAASRAQITSAPRDDQGRVSGLTRRQALELDTRARRQAVAGNVLAGLGVMVAAAGAAIFFTAPAPSLDVTVLRGGVAVAGSL